MKNHIHKSKIIHLLPCDVIPWKSIAEYNEHFGRCVAVAIDHANTIGLPQHDPIWQKHFQDFMCTEGGFLPNRKSDDHLEKTKKTCSSNGRFLKACINFFNYAVLDKDISENECQFDGYKKALASSAKQNHEVSALTFGDTYCLEGNVTFFLTYQQYQEHIFLLYKYKKEIDLLAGLTCSFFINPFKGKKKFQTIKQKIEEKYDHIQKT